MMEMREVWAAGDVAYGAWLALDSSSVAEAVARMDYDYVCVDMQHGVADYTSAVPMIQATLLGANTPIVRVPWNEPGVIGRVLDAGARGIVVPMVNTPDQARAAVAACRYAPAGSRSFGPVLAGLRSGAAPAEVNDAISVIVMIETVEALGQVDDIVAVPGVDAVYVGPADLSVSLGLPPGNNDHVPAFVEALDTIVGACRRAGVVPGIHSTASLTPRRVEQGFRMVTVTSDFVALRERMATDVADARAGASGDSPRAGAMY